MTAVPEVYDPVPAGFLRTGLMAGLIEGRVVVFGHAEDRIQQGVPVLDIAALEVRSCQAAQSNGFVPRTLVTEHHYALDLVNTVLERIVGFSAWYVLSFSTSTSSNNMLTMVAINSRLTASCPI